MNESRAAIRYAKAILDLAVDNKATDAVERDMRSVLDTLGDSKELHQMMASPVVSSEAKKNVLLEVPRNPIGGSPNCCHAIYVIER